MQLKIRNGSFALVLMRSSIYIGFLLMCGLFLGLYLVRLETEKKSIKNILLYLQEIYDSSSTLTEDCATLYFKSLSTFLVVNTTAIPSSPLFILQTAFESPLP